MPMGCGESPDSFEEHFLGAEQAAEKPGYEVKPEKAGQQGLMRARENPAFVSTQSDSGRWREDSFIQKQQVSAASRHGKLASWR